MTNHEPQGAHAHPAPIQAQEDMSINVGKIVGWAEVDLVTEFGIPPRTNCHFLMTAGQITAGQAALYVAETTTGKFGVYTMGPRPDSKAGVVIRRHDLVLFRQPAKE